MATDSSLDRTAAVSVYGWIKLDGTEQDQKILGNESGTAGGYKLGVYNGQVEFEVRDQNNQYYLDRWTPGGVDLRDGKWHFVAGVYDQADGYIETYVDGQEQRQLITNGALVASGSDVIIGREPFANSSFFHGEIADLGIDDSALSATQIANLYNAPTAVSAEALGGTALRVSWLGGSNASSGYTIQYRPTGATDWSTAGTANTGDSAYIIEGLSVGTSYESRVIANYSGGGSSAASASSASVSTGATDESGWYKVTLNGDFTKGITAWNSESDPSDPLRLRDLSSTDGYVQAANWQDAVYKSVIGSVLVTTTGETYAFTPSDAYFEVGDAKTIGSPPEGNLPDVGQVIAFEDSGGRIDNDHNDDYQKVTVEEQPRVSIVATDADASEDNRDPAIFTISRTGSTTESMDVWFGLTGTATPSAQGSDSYPDGIAADGADYTLEGATLDGAGWKVTIPAGAASVSFTAKPLNDSTTESSESIQVILTDDQAGGFHYAAPSTNPTTLPSTAAATQANLEVQSVTLAADTSFDAGPIPQADVDAQVAIVNNPNSTNAQLNKATTALINYYKDYPSLEQFFEQQRSANAANLDAGLRYDSILDSNPIKYTLAVLQDPGTNNLVIHERSSPGAGQQWFVSIEAPNSMKLSAGGTTSSGPFNALSIRSDAHGRFPPITVTPLKSGQGTLQINWHLEADNNAVDGTQGGRPELINLK